MAIDDVCGLWRTACFSLPCLVVDCTVEFVVSAAKVAALAAVFCVA